MAESLAFVGALDQPGDIRHDEAVVLPQLDDAQVGFEGGEGIVGDLGPDGGQAGQQGGFARVRVADQSHVGDQLQFEFELALLARPAFLPASGRPVGGRGEGRVAPAPVSPTGDDKGLVLSDHVRDHRAGLPVLDDGPGGDADHQVGGVPPVHVLALSVRAVPGPVQVLVLEIEQGALARVDLQDDMAAVASVAAVRTAARHVLLAPETAASVAAASGLHVNSRKVDEHEGYPGDRSAAAGPVGRGLPDPHPMEAASESYIRSMMAVPNSEHLTSFASSIRRAKS